MNLYAENILDHYRHPRNKKNPVSPLHRSGEGLGGGVVEHEEANLTCGDVLRIHLTIVDGKIIDLAWDGTGCAISQAAMSLLSDHILTEPNLQSPISNLKALSPQNVYTLLGVPIGPRRVKCALLGLHTLKNALRKLNGLSAQSWSETVGGSGSDAHGEGGLGASPMGEDWSNDVQKRQGTYLPHWRKEDSAYFVTFRLPDALPQATVKEWLRERNDIIKTAAHVKRPLSSHEEDRLEELSWKRIDEHLRKGHGACWLRQSAIAQILAETIRKFDPERYRLFAWCIMPNHAHAVLQPSRDHPLEKTLHSWKSYTAHKANTMLGRTGEFWQTEYYDHLIRNEADRLRCINYTWSNPDQAGMKNWPWRWRWPIHEDSAM